MAGAAEGEAQGKRSNGRSCKVSVRLVPTQLSQNLAPASVSVDVDSPRSRSVSSSVNQSLYFSGRLSREAHLSMHTTRL